MDVQRNKLTAGPPMVNWSTGSMVPNRLACLLILVGVLASSGWSMGVKSQSRPWTSLNDSTLSKSQSWDLRAVGLRSELLRLLAPRCQLLTVGNPDSDFEVSISVNGKTNCKTIIDMIEKAPPLPEPQYPPGPCPEGKACFDGNIY